MKGLVYKIVNNVDDKIYVGCTTTSLKQRFIEHKQDYNRWKKGYKNTTTSFDLFDKYGFDNCKIILIKEYDILDRRHLEICFRELRLSDKARHEKSNFHKSFIKN